jgi:hypothetical protein
MFLRVINGGVRQWLALGLSLTLITAQAVVSGSNLTVVRAEPDTTLQYFGAFNLRQELGTGCDPSRAPLTHGLLDIHVDISQLEGQLCVACETGHSRRGCALVVRSCAESG